MSMREKRRTTHEINTRQNYWERLKKDGTLESDMAAVDAHPLLYVGSLYHAS